MIDVIIPVYKGHAQTRTCIESVLRERQRSPHEVVVIDDSSPEPAITAYLDELARGARINLVRNTQNLGFVQSVNLGMSLHADRDVVLLNSDTEVANDWLDRLHACAHSAPDIATVTPFSNNATICSYPFEGWSGVLPGTLGLAALDRLFAATNAGLTVDLPTAVGFCMFIRRDALSQLGVFDAERFGRGYGEENDFCMRALKAGRRNVLAGDVFIFHEGAVSFTEERLVLTRAATQALLEVHPDYTRRVHEYIIADPANDLRSAIDAARVAQGAVEAQHVLDERTEERSRLVKGLWEIEKLAAERDNLIGQVGQLHYGLEHASACLTERDRQIAELRAGLAYAESLAFQRERDLDRIRRTWVWKALSFVKRWHSRSA